MSKIEIYNNNLSEEELIKIAKKRIRIKRNMYSHITAYVVINAFLIFIYLISENKGSGTPWFVWPLAGWGVFLILDVATSIQSLRFTYNTGAITKELEKIKRKLDR